MTCANPIPDDRLIAYWAHDLDDAECESVEEHLFACAHCTAACERIATLAETIHAQLPPVLSRAEVEGLRARNVRVLENRLAKGERKPIVFPANVDILLHVLGGLDLQQAVGVDLRASDEDTGAVMMSLPNVPFDAAAGEVLIACQRHFATLPPNVVFELSVRVPAGVREVVRYVVPHMFLA